MTLKGKGPVKAVEFPENTRELTVTHGMLRLVRDELAHRIDAAEERSAARDAGLHEAFAKLQGKVDTLGVELHAKIDAVEERSIARDAELRAGMVRLEAKVDTLGAELHAKIDAQGAELHAKIDAQGARLEAKIDAVEARSVARDAELRTEIAVLRVKVEELDAKFEARFNMLSHEMHAGFEVVQATMARHLAIAEDQARQNSVVLEALHGVIQRLDRTERERSEAREPTVTPSRPRRKVPRKKP